MFLPLLLPAELLCPDEPTEARLTAGAEVEEELRLRLQCEAEAECRAVLSRLHDPTPMVVADRVAQIATVLDEPEAVERLLARPVVVRAELSCLVSGASARWTCEGGACTLVVEPATDSAMVALATGVAG